MDTLLEFGRLVAGKLVATPIAVDLAAMTRGIAESFGPAVQRAGLEFVVECPPELSLRWGKIISRGGRAACTRRHRTAWRTAWRCSPDATGTARDSRERRDSAASQALRPPDGHSARSQGINGGRSNGGTVDPARPSPPPCREPRRLLRSSPRSRHSEHQHQKQRSDGQDLGDGAGQTDCGGTTIDRCARAVETPANVPPRTGARARAPPTSRRVAVAVSPELPTDTG